MDNLKRALKRDETLNNKLIRLRKRRDEENRKVTRVTRKRKVTSSDLSRLRRYEKNLLDYDKKITEVLEDIEKNKKRINRYQERIDKENERNYKKLQKQLEHQRNIDKQSVERSAMLLEEIDQLANEIKRSVKDKELIEYDVFLSHSNLDKEVFVSEFSNKLSEKGLIVFEDAKVFRIGQSQTDMINMGILNSRFVVVFLSPNFLKSGWSDYEFKSFLNREINEGRLIILPIWHKITRDEVEQYNPYLADKFALKTNELSIDEIVDHIYDAVSQSKE